MSAHISSLSNLAGRTRSLADLKKEMRRKKKKNKKKEKTGKKHTQQLFEKMKHTSRTVCYMRRGAACT